jgi:ABC-type transport system substrate-binding protein
MVAEAAADIAEQLGRIGVRTQLLRVASDPELERAIEDEADMFMWAFGADYPDAGRGFLEPVFDEEPVLYRDEALAGLLAQARSTRVQDERLGLYRAFEREWIGEHVAMLPLAYKDTRLVHRPWITGMWVHSVGMSSFAHAVVTERPDRGGLLG